jgi:hypothetical protein
VVGDEAVEGDGLTPEQVADVGCETVREAEAGDRTDDKLDVDGAAFVCRGAGMRHLHEQAMGTGADVEAGR